RNIKRNIDGLVVESDAKVIGLVRSTKTEGFLIQSKLRSLAELHMAIQAFSGGKRNACCVIAVMRRRAKNVRRCGQYSTDVAFGSRHDGIRVSAEVRRMNKRAVKMEIQYVKKKTGSGNPSLKTGAAAGIGRQKILTAQVEGKRTSGPIFERDVFSVVLDCQRRRHGDAAK